MPSIEDLLKQSSQPSDGGDTQDLDVEEIGKDKQENKVDAIQAAQFSAQDELEKKITEIKEQRLEEEIKTKAKLAGLGYINLKGIPIPADVLSLLSLGFAEKYEIICFYYIPHKVLRIAVSENKVSDLDLIKNSLYEKLPQVEIEWFLMSNLSFELAKKQYEMLPKIKKETRGVEITPRDFLEMSSIANSLQDLKEKIKNVSTTKIIALIIAVGVKVQASDIHIECEVDGIKLRYRIDGVLHTSCILEKDLWQQIISRLKLLSELKLNITDKPQDGRFSIFLPDDKIDVRVSTLPTSYGESVVMRLLRSRSIGLKFKDLGLSDSALLMLNKQMRRPNGMIITTGPTGSGKTTTLYAILNELNSQENKIITIEDPIEYELSGINQSQVDSSRDYTFAKGLRSIIRQDPDILMVGEMRDLETVDIALNAALTGHLVLSTLHTNDAAGAIPRFLAMGAKSYLLAPALNLIMAQRLVRRLCEKCKQEVELDQGESEKVLGILGSLGGSGKGEDGLAAIKFYGPGRCNECNQLGYKGRIGVFEMFEMTQEIEQVILSGEVSEYKIRQIAVKNEMITMAQDGILKAMQGVTSIEEVFRVAE